MKHKIHKKSIIPSEVLLPIIETAEYWRSPAIKAIPSRCLWTSRIGKIEQSVCLWNGVYFTVIIQFEAKDESELIYESVLHEVHHLYEFAKHNQPNEEKVIQAVGRILNHYRAEDYRAIGMIANWRVDKWM